MPDNSTDPNKPDPKDPPPCLWLAGGIDLLKEGEGWTVHLQEDAVTADFFAVVVDENNVAQGVVYLKAGQVDDLIVAAIAANADVVGFPTSSARPCDIPFDFDTAKAAATTKLTRSSNEAPDLKKGDPLAAGTTLRRYIERLNKQRRILADKLRKPVTLPNKEACSDHGSTSKQTAS